jgi:hypothetical protein
MFLGQVFAHADDLRALTSKQKCRPDPKYPHNMELSGELAAGGYRVNLDGNTGEKHAILRMRRMGRAT